MKIIDKQLFLTSAFDKKLTFLLLPILNKMDNNNTTQISTKHFSSMEKDHKYLEKLLSDLIRCYPCYLGDGSGIKEAQAIVRQELISLGFIVKEISVTENEIKKHPLYVDVSDWGPLFSDYSPEKNISQTGTLIIDKHAPMLALNGHVDVEPVFDPTIWADPTLWKSGQVVGNKIYGRGSADMLGGVAGMLFALKHVLSNSKSPCVNISFHSVADEEVGGNGTLKCLLTGQKPDWALIAEPTELSINQQSLGFHHFVIKTLGRSVHMSQAGNNQNAIDVSMEVHKRLKGLIKKLNKIIKLAPEFRNININPLIVGRINGGFDPAVPAEECTLEGVLFSSSNQTKKDIEKLLDQALTGNTPLNATSYISNMSFDGSNSSDQAVSNTLLQSGKEVNIQLPVNGFPSPCDMRLYTSFGVPTTIFGPGSLKQAHSANEFVRREELFNFSKIMVNFLQNFSGNN